MQSSSLFLKRVFFPVSAITAFWLTFYPVGEKDDSLHPSMILPAALSVYPTQSNLDLRVPYINYNRGLPGTWTEEMRLRFDALKTIK